MDEDILHQPHDKFFKLAFSLPIVVQESLNAFLPAPLLARVDLSGITPDTTSYVSENLKSYFSDIVWNVPINGKNMKVAFLFEHKTE